VSNLEARPAETECHGDAAGAAETLAPREVPLGGPRAMTVRRTLPHRDRRMVGAWCFVDHYGPDSVHDGGMFVPPHPHTGLQTVSWLLSGEVLHHDSLGSEQVIRPGQLNLMTAGRGIAHAEVTPPASTERLHGVQLWVALPSSSRDTAATFEHHAELPTVGLPGGVATVIVGDFAGVRSAATTFTDLLGVELALGAGADVEVPVRPDHEHALLALDEDVTIGEAAVSHGALHYLPPGPNEIRVRALRASRVLLLGGLPFEETVVMWWNFLGTDHDSIAAARADWQSSSPRFGEVPGYDSRLAAPALPGTRLKARGRQRN
jgi:redox-sensitive bicupin YhaK (pirin superfamily)